MFGPNKAEIMEAVREALEEVGIDRETAAEEGELVVLDLDRRRVYFETIEQEEGF